MTMTWMALGAALIAAIARMPEAQAAPATFATSLSGAIEVPPNASPGTGNALITIDAAADTMRVQVTFSDLLGLTTASHIHCCTAAPFDVTATAGVATAVPTFPGFPLGVTFGTYDQTFDLTDPAAYNPAFVSAQGGTVTAAEAALIAGIEAGTAYLNVHSDLFPRGEIRGFLQEVPEPASLLLLAGAFGAMLPLIRRRYSDDRT